VAHKNTSIGVQHVYKVLQFAFHQLATDCAYHDDCAGADGGKDGEFTHTGAVHQHKHISNNI
jgi:hypothetical protein